jgi:peptidyl-tRNA hydrolase, PTH1 family
MKLIVGLGNPGEKYAKTRHNVGFMVIDELAQKFSSSDYRFIKENKFEAETLKVHYKDEELFLVKPQTMMNASGEAVNKLMRFYNLQLNDLWVIHDDLDLPLGHLKIVKGRGSAGHHGVDSIIQKLGKDEFTRFRVGIDYKMIIDKHERPREVEDYVLMVPQGKEAVELVKGIDKTVKAVEIALKEGIEKAMNRLNG